MTGGVADVFSCQIKIGLQYVTMYYPYDKLHEFSCNPRSTSLHDVFCQEYKMVWGRYEKVDHNSLLYGYAGLSNKER